MSKMHHIEYHKDQVDEGDRVLIMTWVHIQRFDRFDQGCDLKEKGKLEFYFLTVRKLLFDWRSLMLNNNVRPVWIPIRMGIAVGGSAKTAWREMNRLTWISGTSHTWYAINSGNKRCTDKRYGCFASERGIFVIWLQFSRCSQSWRKILFWAPVSRTEWL